MGTYVLNGVPNAGIPPPAADPISPEAQKELLERAIAYKVRQGAELAHRSDFQAVIKLGKPVNHVLHLLLSVFTLGFWLIVWLILAATGGESTVTLSVDERGEVVQRR